VQDECIKFGIAMLFGCNFIIQKFFVDKLETPEKDLFLGAMVKIVEERFAIIEKFEISKVTTYMDLAFLIDDEDMQEDVQFDNIDIYEPYDEEVKYSMDIIIRILRFLQCCCEEQ